MVPRARSPAERVFSLLELCEPILGELPIQDLIRISHVSRAFLNNISSSKALRRSIQRWRECDLNNLALNGDYDSFPTGFVSSYDFDTPYLRIREPPWIFHTILGYDYGTRVEDYENSSANDGILVTYRCTVEEEYFVYIPFSIEFPVLALQLSKLLFDHGTFTFEASWKSRVDGSSDDSQTAFTESFDGTGEGDTSYMFAYLQTWYTTDSKIPVWSLNKQKKTTAGKASTANVVDWKHWAQINGKTQPLQGRKPGWKGWWQGRVWGKGHRGTIWNEEVPRRTSTEIEELDLNFSGPVLKHSYIPNEAIGIINRHGHIRDGYQTDLQLHLQRSYILRYGNPVRKPRLRTRYSVEMIECTFSS